MARGAIILFAGIVLSVVGLVFDDAWSRILGGTMIGLGASGVILWGRKP